MGVNGQRPDGRTVYPNTYCLRCEFVDAIKLDVHSGRGSGVWNETEVYYTSAYNRQ